VWLSCASRMTACSCGLGQVPIIAEAGESPGALAELICLGHRMPDASPVQAGMRHAPASCRRRDVPADEPLLETCEDERRDIATHLSLEAR
jgi:hypothetical protein